MASNLTLFALTAWIRAKEAGRLRERTFAHRYDILYLRFQDHTYYWITTTLARRTVLVTVIAFITERGARSAAALCGARGF